LSGRWLTECRSSAKYSALIDPREAYEIWHAQTGPDLPIADTPWHRLVLTHLNFARDLAGRRVLEIGCGRGGFLCSLAMKRLQPAPTFVGIDYASNAVAQARDLALKHGCPAIAFEVGDIQTLGHPTATFDTCQAVPGNDRGGARLMNIDQVIGASRAKRRAGAAQDQQRKEEAVEASAELPA
jgi:SAM-dependent methyltransferase